MKTMKTIRTTLALLLLLTAGSLFSQGYMILGYGPSFPLGETKTYIDRMSWRSFNIEAGAFLTRNLSVGATFTWFGYYKEFPNDTYVNIGGTPVTVSGKQWRTANLYPLEAVVRFYIPIKRLAFRPFIAAGLGPCFLSRRLDFGIYTFTKNYTQFGFFPEAGFSYWFNSGFGAGMEAKYHYALATGDLPATSNVSVMVRLIWQFGSRDLTFTE